MYICLLLHLLHQRQSIFYMKNIIFTFSFLIITVINANTQWVFGGGMKFNSNDDFKGLAINAKIGKDISDKFDLNLEVGHYIASKATWSFDFDLHYRLFNINDKLIINPMAGINFTKTEIVNNSLGLGISFRIPDDRYTYYLEPKWILDYRQFVFSVGVLL